MLSIGAGRCKDGMPPQASRGASSDLGVDDDSSSACGSCSGHEHEDEDERPAVAVVERQLWGRLDGSVPLEVTR